MKQTRELDGPSKALAVAIVVIVVLIALARIVGVSGTRCADGTFSGSHGRGTCSAHGGIAR